MPGKRGTRTSPTPFARPVCEVTKLLRKLACPTGSILTEMPFSGPRYSLAPILKLSRLVSEQDCKLIIVEGCGVTVTIGTNIVRLCVSALLAFAIAKLVFAPLFFVLWPGFYWGWHYLSRRRKSPEPGVPRLVAEKQSPVVAVANRRSALQRIIRIAGVVIVGWIAASVLLLFIARGFGERKAERARGTVHPGMTMAEVLHSVTGWLVLGASSNAPETDSDHFRALNLHPCSESGKFFYFDRALSKDRQISESEALALLHQNLGDGYSWQFRYTFINSSPQHFSFKVLFDKDGSVQEVTPVYGWD